MKVGSLFSGIGGLDLGLERAGMEVVWQVEFDPYCQKVLKKHWPEVPCYGDIKEVIFTRVAPIDLLCGGFPCQPVSHAGKRQGDQDERWLWPEYYRAICETKPRWILVENVPGLLSFKGGRLFSGILRDLATSGYDAEWDLLPAAAFGAPHLRYRVFLIAYPSGTRGARESSIKIDRHGRNIGREKAKVFPRKFANPHCKGLEKWEAYQDKEGAYFEFNRGGQWAIEPNVGRVANGVPSRVDRLKCLGNAVVPQVAEWIGRRIMEVENE